MYVSGLTADHVGKTVNLPDLSVLGRCRQGTLHRIRLLSDGVFRLQIGTHLHTVPGNAHINILDEVEVGGL